MKAFATMLLLGAFLIITSWTPSGQWLNVQAGEYSNSALLSWTPPTENIDGSVLTDLTGYNIYIGFAPRQYEPEMTITIGPGLTSYLVENLEYGKRYYFTMTALNSSGLESEYSNEVWKEIKMPVIEDPTPEPPPAPAPVRPKAPAGLVAADQAR